MRGRKSDVFRMDFWIFIIKYALNEYYESAHTAKKKKKLGSIKDGGEIYPSVSIRQPEKIFIGKNVTIGPGSRLWPGTGEIRIDDDVLIGPGVQLFASNHGIKKGESIITQPSISDDITIDADCWIGSNSVINAGVKLGKGTVVAAGAVVTKATAPYSIVAGVPAKVIGERS